MYLVFCFLEPWDGAFHSINYFKYYARTKDPILVSAVSAFVSAITMLIFKCSTESSINYWGMPHDIPQIIALLWLGVIGSEFCLYLYCSLIQNAGAVFASMILYKNST